MLVKINKLDVFARTYKFKATRGSKTYTTMIGGLATLLGLAVVSVLSFRSFLDCRKTTKPVVSVNRIRMKQPLRLNLSKHEIGLNFAVLNASQVLSIEQMKQYFTFVGEFQTREKNKEGLVVEKVEKVDIFRCKHTVGAKIGPQTEWLLDFAVCPDFDPERFFVEGGSQMLPFRRFVAKIYPCSLQNRSKCASWTQLALTIIGTVPIIKVANYSRKKDPLELFIDVDNGKYIGMASKSIITTYYKKNFIFGDDSDFLNQKLEHSYIDVDKVEGKSGTRFSLSSYCSSEEIESGECEPYMEMRMRSSFEKMIIQRRYKKFFRSVSEIGGFADLIMILIYSLYFLYSTWSYKAWMRGQLVDHFLEMIQNRIKIIDKKKISQKYKQTRRESLISARIRRRDKFSKQLKSQTNGKMSIDHHISILKEVGVLMELNFKSKVIFEILSPENADFNALISKVIFYRKRSKKKLEAKIKENQVHPDFDGQKSTRRSLNHVIETELESERIGDKGQKRGRRSRTLNKIEKLFGSSRQPREKKMNTKLKRGNGRTVQQKSLQKEIENNSFTTEFEKFDDEA